MSPKPTTLDLLRAHADIRTVLFEVVEKVRESEKLSAALDASLGTDPTADNIRARFLTKRVAYEITLVFDAEAWKAVTYNRDDDRYYRRELQALQDNIEDTNSLLSELLFRLREDDDLRTYEARVKITAARIALHTAAASVELAFRRLPAPTTELAR